MKGMKPIVTVGDLMEYLQLCDKDAVLRLMPEDEGDGFPVGGVLTFQSSQPPEVWILIDEFSEIESQALEWAAGSPIDAEDVVDRPGAREAAQKAPTEPVDVVQVRGKLRSA